MDFDTLLVLWMVAFGLHALLQLVLLCRIISGR
jgi:hypothetical protein